MTFTFDGAACVVVAPGTAAATAVPGSLLEPGPGAAAAVAATAAAAFCWTTCPLSPGLPMRMSTFRLVGVICVPATGGVVGAVGATGVAGVGTVVAGGLGELGLPSARAGEARPSAKAETAPTVTHAHVTRPKVRAARVRNSSAGPCVIQAKYPNDYRFMHVLAFLARPIHHDDVDVVVSLL